VTYYCGVDLGGTKILAAIASEDGGILAESTTPTHGSPGGVGAAVVRAVADLCAQVPMATDDLAVTVVAGAGAPQPDGVMHLAPNLERGSRLDLAGELRLALGEVILENDVNAAAVAESTNLGVDTFVFIAVGTGIGMGIVVGSELLRGAHGAAGEIGFLPFGADPLDPDNHRHGPLEEVVSGRGIEMRFRHRTGQQRTAPEIFARAGELAGGPESDLIDEMSYEAARAIVAVCAVIDPEVVVLGGGIGSRADFHTRILRWLAALGHAHVDLRLSSFSARATLEGALELARRSLDVHQYEGPASA
jgi:glucokinase